MKVNSSAAINLIAQQLPLSICPFWARLINGAENCTENRKISCLNLIHFYCRWNHKLEMRFCLNLKPTINDVYWRNFLFFLHFFVDLLRTSHIFLGKSAFVLHHMKNFQNQHVVFFLIG